MDQKIYHGQISPDDIAQALIGHYNRGNLRVQKVGSGNNVTVQIASSSNSNSGGQTALSVNLLKVEDGISVQIGQQAWMGVAASLGLSALAALRNPLNLLNRLDDIAQDIENLQLKDEVWQVIDGIARASGTGQQLSDRLRRLECEYCGCANPVGQSACVSCGAPLGSIQPFTCKKCGFVLQRAERSCPNCGALI